MKQTLSNSQAVDILKADNCANWSHWGACALIEYYSDLEEDLGHEIELDSVAIRCEWSEWDSVHEWAENYFSEDDLESLLEGADDEDERLIDYIQDHGQIIQNFEDGNMGINRQICLISEF